MEISIVIKMQQVNFETSMKNIPLGGKKEYSFIPSVADDPFGETDCSTHGIDSQLVILCIMSS